MKQLILLRHGETVDSRDGIISGQRDIPLTPKGRRSVREVAWRLARYGVRKIISSDLSRAFETASIIADELGLTAPTVDYRLRERDWGTATGKLKMSIANLKDPETALGCEPLDHMRARFEDALTDLDGFTLVVAHAGPIRDYLKYHHLAHGEENLEPAAFVTIKLPGANPHIPRPFPLHGVTITGGSLTGIVTYVHSQVDIRSITHDSLVLLASCPKEVAVEALKNGNPAVNLTGSLTAHLTCGRLTMGPYAVATQWPAGLPAEGSFLEIACHDDSASADVCQLIADVPPRQTEYAFNAGGKAAGLWLLQELGHHVPPFMVLPANCINAWRNQGTLPANLTTWCCAIMPATTWAVRSSADVEDSALNPLSGTFETILDVPQSNLPTAIIKVIQSSQGREIKSRMDMGLIDVPPQMSVIIQRMVPDVSFAGTIFIPSPDDPTTFVIEAVVNNTGDRLMDGTQSPNIRARFDYTCTLKTFDIGSNVIDCAIIEALGREAMDIYLSSGCGDLEFAVDSRQVVWWLQARPLAIPVLSVDRTGFSPAAVRYYQQIAFRTPEANQMPPASFRLINEQSDHFGYTAGLLRSDAIFREFVCTFPSHLRRVTDFGHTVTQDIQSIVNNLDRQEPSHVLDRLILHGAVQAPFSIPTSEAQLERYQSHSQTHVIDSSLITFLASIGQLLSTPISGLDLLRILRQPEHTSSVLTQKEAVLHFLQSASPTDDEILDCLVPDLRDLPDTSPDGISKIYETILTHYQLPASAETLAISLKKQITQGWTDFADMQSSRAKLLYDAHEKISEQDYATLSAWADYLMMKAEANEIHSLCRGKIFVWFARIGYIPN